MHDYRNEEENKQGDKTTTKPGRCEMFIFYYVSYNFIFG